MKIADEIAQQRKLLENAVAQALEFAQEQSDAAEVAVSKTTGLSVSTRFGDVENVEFTNDGALGITVYCQQRKGSASVTELSAESIKKAVQAALDIARFSSEDPCAGPAEPELLAWQAPDLDLFHPVDLTVEQALNFAATAEQQALGADPKIVNTEGGSFDSYHGIKVFGSSYGVRQSYCMSRYSLACSVIAEQAGEMEREHAYTVARDIRELQSSQWVGEECARRALARLSPRKLATQNAAVIFSAEVASGLFGHLVAAISGGNLYRRSSFLLDHLGKVILPEWMTIDEQPHLLKGLASAPFDSEGVKTQAKKIVQQGVLQSYLLTTYSARKLNMSSTGHAGGIHNWHILGSSKPFNALLQEMDRGVLITELMGQGVNLVTGDYSRGAAGFWVERGEIQYPVSGITIAGNLKEMLLNIVAIGDDIETRRAIRCGSILIPSIRIGGE